MNTTTVTSGLRVFFLLRGLCSAPCRAYKSCWELRRLNEKIDGLIESRRQ